MANTWRGDQRKFRELGSEHSGPVREVDLFDQPRPTGSRARRRLLQGLVGLIPIALLVALGRSSFGQHDHQAQPVSLEIGTCFNATGPADDDVTVKTVACDHAHRYEVIGAPNQNASGVSASCKSVLSDYVVDLWTLPAGAKVGVLDYQSTHYCFLQPASGNVSRSWQADRSALSPDAALVLATFAPVDEALASLPAPDTLTSLLDVQQAVSAAIDVVHQTDLRLVQAHWTAAVSDPVEKLVAHYHQWSSLWDTLKAATTEETARAAYAAAFEFGPDYEDYLALRRLVGLPTVQGQPING